MQPEAITAAPLALGYRLRGLDRVGRLKVLFSFQVMLAAGLVVITAFTIANRFNDPDLWFHLKLGEVVWTTHTIPSTDIFSHTAYGHPWTAHEWLAELAIYGVYRLGGYTGLMLAFLAWASLLFVLVYVLCYRRSGSALAAFMGAVCAWFFSTVGLAIRPMLIGYLFLVLELLLVEGATRRRHLLFLLPPLFAIWVNCHGSYLFGMGVLAVYWLCSFWRGKWGPVTAEGSDPKTRQTMAWALVLSAAGLCANPVGFRLLLYPLNVAFRLRVSMNAVDEWLPLNLASDRGVGVILVIVGILVSSFLSRSQLRLRDLAVAGMGLALALQHVRMVFVFGIVVSPLMCQALASLFGKDGRREHPLANAALMLLFLAAIVNAFPTSGALERQLREKSPAGAVEFIRRNGLRGPMLNEYVFGDYLIWALPEEKVFVDGRGDVFDWTGVLAEYGRWVTHAENPSILLEKYRIRFCLLSTNSSMGPVISRLGWRKVYSDDVAAIFTH